MSSELIIDLDETAYFNEKSFLKNEGENNRLILHPRAQLGRLGTPKIEFLGNNNTFILHERVNVKRGHYRLTGDGNTIELGPRTTINGAYFLCHGGVSITTGEDCMLSYELELRTTDAHSLFDRQSGELKNPPAGISIGDHCWIGKGACILQGVSLTNDVVVGTKSLVTKSCNEPYVALAGIPAKIVSRDTAWDRTPP